MQKYKIGRASILRPRDGNGRFQFGLRTLLLAVALAAIASWVCYVVRPWWKRDPDQVRFLEAAKRIKAGMTIYEPFQLVEHVDYACRYYYETFGSHEGKTILMTSYCWDDVIYCVYFAPDATRLRSARANSKREDSSGRTGAAEPSEQTARLRRLSHRRSPGRRSPTC